MNIIPLWKAIFLGAVQGATEFLPVSSSAHLVILQQYLGLSQDGAFLMAFDVALHVGTLAAVILFFYSDFSWLIKDRTGRKVLFYLVLATIPAAVIGFFLKDFFEIFFADMISASFFLLLTGWILWLTRKAKPAEFDFINMKWKQALTIGFAQAVAILPGISRSGSTIATGLFLKLDPTTAVRFSFLMAIPAIGGATVLELDKFAAMDKTMLFPIFIGVLVSFGVGYVSIRWMMKLVQGKKLSFFSYYCWIVGGFVFVKELFF